jgi:hypothetical protein
LDVPHLLRGIVNSTKQGKSIYSIDGLISTTSSLKSGVVGKSEYGMSRGNAPNSLSSSSNSGEDMKSLRKSELWRNSGELVGEVTTHDGESGVLG